MRPMSTPLRTSWVLRIAVPGYLLFFGAGLLVAAVLVFLYLPDEPFVTVLSGLGGLTMLAAALALLTVARDR